MIRIILGSSYIPIMPLLQGGGSFKGLGFRAVKVAFSYVKKHLTKDHSRGPCAKGPSTKIPDKVSRFSGPLEDGSKD